MNIVTLVVKRTISRRLIYIFSKVDPRIYAIAFQILDSSSECLIAAHS